MDETFNAWAADGLVWLPERGMGFYPVKAEPYDVAYFEKYQGYAATDTGRALTAQRVALVKRHWQGPVCDVGIGSGKFVEAHGAATGYDVNPAGAEWLRDRGVWQSPYAEIVDAATFWDSLEHIASPAALLRNVSRWVFVSLPIFTDVNHLLRSKHFRKDEHRWYWTCNGFLEWMAAQGFAVVEANDMEVRLGREDIATFAFKRTT